MPLGPQRPRPLSVERRPREAHARGTAGGGSHWVTKVGTPRAARSWRARSSSRGSARSALFSTTTRFRRSAFASNSGFWRPGGPSEPSPPPSPHPPPGPGDRAVLPPLAGHIPDPANPVGKPVHDGTPPCDQKVYFAPGHLSLPPFPPDPPPPAHGSLPGGPQAGERQAGVPHLRRRDGKEGGGGRGGRRCPVPAPCPRLGNPREGPSVRCLVRLSGCGTQ